MNAAEDLVVQAAPSWADLEPLGSQQLRARVAPPRLSGAPGDVFELVIDLTVPAGGVAEADVGARLPRSCPERHINFDGTFCLGLRRRTIETAADADAFWLTLRTYLLSQQFAERNGRWPSGRGLSHGSAADHQLAAEAVAARCGLGKAYADAIDHGVGWLAGSLPKLVQAGGCAHPMESEPDRDGSLLVDDNCHSCRALADLVGIEAARRDADAAFVKWAKVYRTCCETMPVCPIREDFTVTSTEPKHD